MHQLKRNKATTKIPLGVTKIQIDTELKIPRRLVGSGEIEAYNKFIRLLRSESQLTGTGWALSDN